MGERACKNSDSVDEGKAGVHDYERCAAHPAQSALSLQELAAKGLGADNDAHPRRKELELSEESRRGHAQGSQEWAVTASHYGKEYHRPRHFLVKQKKADAPRDLCQCETLAVQGRAKPWQKDCAPNVQTRWRGTGRGAHDCP